MIAPLYIHGMGCISCQPTFKENYFFEEVVSYHQNPAPILDPEYKQFIPPLQLRRMNKSMKAALYASKLALQQAGIDQIDAVITGTGLGCLNDSERFVETILEDEMQLLNPTPFIQSTHNMAAATMALALKCSGYNMTYVNGSNSVESALLDTMLYLSEHSERTVLVGGVDEIGPKTYEFWKVANYLNTDQPQIPIPLGQPEIKGELVSEGSTIFAVSSKPAKNTLAKVEAISFDLEVSNPEQYLFDFLAKNRIDPSHIDLLITGVNGDFEYDQLYFEIAESMFPNTPNIGYKHLVGEYDTASAAAIYIGSEILKRQEIPTVLRLDQKPLANNKLERILIYNHRRNTQHSLILLSNTWTR